MLPNQDYWCIREGFPEKMKTEVKTEGTVNMRQKKGWKKNCERENGTLGDTEKGHCS